VSNVSIANPTLENDINQACNLLWRDNNCSSRMDYIEHIAWLLFLKFLDAQEQAWQAEAAMMGNGYQPLLPDDLRWRKWTSFSADDIIEFIRGRLLPYLRELSGDDFRTNVARIFSDRTVIVAASGYILKDVLQILDEIDFNHDDDVFIFSKVFEDQLARLGNEKQNMGEVYTPRPVVRFLIDVIDPQLGEKIYDPACGTGGFLAQAYLHIREQHPQLNVDQYEHLQNEAFWGNEKGSREALLGLINVILHGVSGVNIRRQNTLEEDVKRPVPEFDVVLTNPPFSGRENPQIRNNFPINASATELLFIEHVIAKLHQRAGARCGMVVPEGILFGSGAFADVKKILLEQFNLQMVVSLPVGTFAPYADVKTALLFFERPGPTEQVLFYELPLREGLQKFSKGNPIGDADFAEARAVWEIWRAYLAGGARDEMPFPHASQRRLDWQAYWQWQDYQDAQDDSLEAPTLPPTERPQPPYTVWVEKLADIQAKGYDLSAANPNQPKRDLLPDPAELTQHMISEMEQVLTILQDLHVELMDSKDEK
jgi:type I restriction enzyme M protein